MITRPAPKPGLAESIPPSAGRLLDHLDWRQVVDEAGFIRVTGNTFLWESLGSGEHVGTRQAHFENGAPGYQVDRTALNAVMLGATVRSGVVLIDGATVISAEAGVVRYRQENGDGEVWARWVLDCSGRAGVVARLGWRRAVPQLRTLAIAGIWERADAWPLPDPSHTVVEGHSDGWAWSIPVSATQRHVTVMLDPRLTNIMGTAGGANALADAYHAELGRATGLNALTRGATLIAPPFARDATPYTAYQVAAPNLLLVGDAASFVDPLSSYGVKKALASAWLAAVVARTCLADSAMLRPALALYEARERAMYDALESQRASLAQAVLGDEASSDFWRTRAESDAVDGNAEPNEDVDVERLRRDPDIISALDELKRRSSIAFTAGSGLEHVRQATVRDDRVILEEQLRVPAFPGGIRYVRNVDLVALAGFALTAAHVPDLYEVYCSRKSPVPISDFLGALALLIGKGILEFA